MNKLIKGLVISILSIILLYGGFIGYVHIKVNQEITDLQIIYLQNRLNYLAEEQVINDNINNVEFKQLKKNTNETFRTIFDIFQISIDYNYNNFEIIYEKLRKPDIDLLLESSVLIQTPTSSGSGTVIKKDNGFTYILTCYHVIEEKPIIIKEETELTIIKEAIDPPEETQTNITVSYLLRNENYEEIGNVRYIAEIVSYDEEKDLALLRIFTKDENLNIVSIAKEEPKIGDTVYSIGNPLSINRTLSKGILSTKEKDFYISDNTITFGNSGGGLFNNKGELIGVPSNVMVYIFQIPESSLGLSRDLNTIKDFLEGVDY